MLVVVGALSVFLTVVLYAPHAAPAARAQDDGSFDPSTYDYSGMSFDGGDGSTYTLGACCTDTSSSYYPDTSYASTDCGCDYTSPSYSYSTPTYTYPSQPTYPTPTYTYVQPQQAPTVINNNNNQNTNTNTNTNIVTVNTGGTTPTTPTQPTVNPLSVTCSANPSSVNYGQTVNYSASVSGGTGGYSYNWSGPNLSSYGQTASATYYTTGQQYATVTVTSGGQSGSATCYSTVNNQQNNQNLTAYCFANPTVANINNTVTWTAQASGGNGSYYYSWSGANLSGNGQTVYQSYPYAGTQNATLMVTSNGQTAYANCSTNVTGVASAVITQNPTGGLSSGVYLSQVPYTGAGPNWKITFFILGIFGWSALAAYVIMKRKGMTLATAGDASSGSLAAAFGTSMSDRIAAFKAANQARKGY